MFAGSGETIEMKKTEEADYKLDWVESWRIEVAGRTKSDGRLVLEAFSVISYDDENGSYRMLV